MSLLVAKFSVVTQVTHSIALWTEQSDCCRLLKSSASPPLLTVMENVLSDLTWTCFYEIGKDHSMMEFQAWRLNKVGS